MVQVSAKINNNIFFRGPPPAVPLHNPTAGSYKRVVKAKIQTFPIQHIYQNSSAVTPMPGREL